MKCLRQRITYPFGSTLMQAFFVNFFFAAKLFPPPKKICIDDDDNYIIYAAQYKFILIK
jgi:hypothetical protein